MKFLTKANLVTLGLPPFWVVDVDEALGGFYFAFSSSDNSAFWTLLVTLS